MSTTVEMIAKLKEALARGVLSVEHEGKKIVYQSAADIERRLAYFQDVERKERGGARVTFGEYRRS